MELLLFKMFIRNLTQFDWNDSVNCHMIKTTYTLTQFRLNIRSSQNNYNKRIMLLVRLLETFPTSTSTTHRLSITTQKWCVPNLFKSNYYLWQVGKYVSLPVEYNKNISERFLCQMWMCAMLKISGSVSVF